jgi:hypothetical protein
MKKHSYLLLILFGAIFWTSCANDDENDAPGNPVLNSKTEFSSALFGDSLPFTIEVKDEKAPLSTLKVYLYFGEEKVSETVIRTKTNGEYTGKIFIPYYANIPDGVATLKFILQNIHLTTADLSYNLPVSRPDYPYLILVTDKAAYPMERTALHQYAATEIFPSTDLPAYIKAPIVGAFGNEITFGWENGAVTQGVKENIPFSSSQSGRYSVTFNTKTYEATPFLNVLCNGAKMDRLDNDNFKIDLDLTPGQEISIEGIGNVADWWIDPDFFTTTDEAGKLKFVPVAGKYRILANFKFQYFKVEAMSGNELATLQADGSGAIWVIGDNVGKPSVTNNVVGWDTGKGLCMAPVGNKKYQLSLVGGQTVSTESINFKFFHQKDWGGEFNGETLTTVSDIVFVGDGSNGRDSGNLGLVGTLEEGATYVFVVDVSAGIDQAVLTVTKAE